MNKKIKGSLFLLSATLLLAACGDSKDKSSSSSSSSSASTTEVEQVAKIGIPQEVASIDPAIATDLVSFGLINQVYEGLYSLDENNVPIPAGAAEMAEVSEDGKTYKVKLREDAKWSNGDPVVAGDYVYAWQRVVNPETGSEYAYLFENVENGTDIINGDKGVEELGIKAINDHELEITLVAPTPYFNSLLAFPSFFPLNEKAVEEAGDQYATTSDTSVFNGPFLLVEFEGAGSDTEWAYERNPDYWGADDIQMDRIEALVVKESSTGLNLYEDGQLDDVIVTGELAQQYKDDENYVPIQDGRTVYVDMNQENKNQHFDNENLRKALFYAVDAETIVTNILGDGSEAVTGIVPRTLATNPDTGADFVDDSEAYKVYDEDKAKEYYDKAKKELGVDSVSFDIMTDDNDSTKKIAEFLQGSFKDVLGIESTVTAVTKPIRLERSGKGDYDIVVTGWGADYNDVSSFLDLFVTGNTYNRGKYSNPKYDALIEETKTTNATDPAARWQNYLDAEKILLGDDAGIIPVYQVVEGHLRNPELKGYVPHSAGAPYDYKYMYME